MMKNLYFLIENYWFKLPQQLRFVLLGGFNTLLSYLIFVFLIKIATFSYQFSLIAQYLITVNISIFSMRYYVFRSTHSLKTEYSKAWSVYLLMLAFNYLFLYITIDRFRSIYYSVRLLIPFFQQQSPTYFTVFILFENKKSLRRNGGFCIASTDY